MHLNGAVVFDGRDLGLRAAAKGIVALDGGIAYGICVMDEPSLGIILGVGDATLLVLIDLFASSQLARGVVALQGTGFADLFAVDEMSMQVISVCIDLSKRCCLGE